MELLYNMTNKNKIPEIYNTLFICSYIFYDENLYKINPLTTNLEYETLEYDLEISDYLYKNELLYALGLKDYTEEIINEKIKKLYNIIFIEDNDIHINNNIKDNLELIMKNLASSINCNDLEIGFILLFSYHLFHITHICLIELINTGVIDPKNMDILNMTISQFNEKSNT